MSEHLKEANRQLKRLDIWADELPNWALPLAVAVDEIKMHLEAQNPPAETQRSEQPSSQDIEMAEGTKPISSISFQSSYHVNPGGSLELYPTGDIRALRNSLTSLGATLVEVTFSLLTSKASTPPAGSPSPLTAAPTPEASGVAGSFPMWAGDYYQGDSDALREALTPASTSPAEDASREGGEHDCWYTSGTSLLCGWCSKPRPTEARDER